MTSANIETASPASFAGVVADEIIASIQDVLSEQDRCTIALSGGSTPGAIYRLLSKPPRVNEVDWSKVVLYWGDERFVPYDHTHSNYRMVRETLLEFLPRNGPGVFPVDTDLPTAEEAAKAYGDLIQEHEGAEPTLDLVLLGLGSDGHFASVFPQSPLIENSNGIAAATQNPEGDTRVTLTPQVLFGAKKVLFIVRGEGKADIVHKVIEEDGPELPIPARLYKRAGSRVTWFLDSEAAANL